MKLIFKFKSFALLVNNKKTSNVQYNSLNCSYVNEILTGNVIIMLEMQLLSGL